MEQEKYTLTVEEMRTLDMLMTILNNVGGYDKDIIKLTVKHIKSIIKKD